MVGAHAALAIVAALEHRDRTGEGQLVEVPLLEVATAVTAEQVIRYSIDGTLLDRRGTAGVYRDARRRRRGSRSISASDPMPRRGARASGARRATPRPPRPSCAPRESPAAAMVPGYATLDDPQLRARGFFEAIDHPHVGAPGVPDAGRCACRPARDATGAGPRRRSASTPTTCSAASSASTDDELARLRERARDRRRAVTSADRISPEAGTGSSVGLPACWRPRTRPRRDRARGVRGRARRRRRPVPAGHRAGRAPAPQLPDRLLRRVRVEHRHVDAERRARRVRVEAHRLVGLRRPRVLRAARARCCSSRRSAGCWPTSSTAGGSSSARSSRSSGSRSALAGIALSSHPSHVLIVVAVFAVGIANALGAPGLNAILPTLVPREDLPGAVALASVQMNLSRVIGPIIGAAIYYCAQRGAGVRDRTRSTYLFAVIGLLWATYPRRTNARGGGARLRPAPLGRAHRPPRPADLAHPRDAVLVLVLLARVRGLDAGDRRARASASARRAGSTACSTRASAWARRWAR